MNIFGLGQNFISQVTCLSQRIDIDLPSKEQASLVLFGLNDHFWMQMIDGKYHKFGPMVFDEGLHRQGLKEPGFLCSLKEGFIFAGEHLTEKLTIQFYKELHKKLCAHFKGKETCTRIAAKEAGIFSRGGSCEAITLEELAAESMEAQTHYKIFKCLESSEEDYQISKKWIEDWVKNWQLKIEQLNCYISQIGNELNVPIATFRYNPYEEWRGSININFECPPACEVERVIQMLFDQYEEKINSLNEELKHIEKDEERRKLAYKKVSVIAYLFQLLEWLHPFSDGQTRTDCVLQAKLLCEQGFNPVILDNPSISQFSLFSEWNEYLLKGIEKWKLEREQLG